MSRGGKEAKYGGRVHTGTWAVSLGNNKGPSSKGRGARVLSHDTKPRFTLT